MKTPLSTFRAEENSEFRIQNSKFFPAFIPFCALLLALPAQAATTLTWNSTASTTAWATGANWIGGSAPANDLTTNIALFDSTSYTSQPNYGTTSINGIAVGDGTTATAPLTLSGTALTIGDGGILINAASGSVTLNGAAKFSANQTWTNNSTSLFTVGAGITNGATNTPLTLTIGGSGNTTISGIIGNGTGTSTTALNKTGAGTLTLSNAGNTFTGGVKINGGTLSIATGGNLGPAPGSYLANFIEFTGNSTLQITAATTFTATRGITIDSGVTGTIDTVATTLTNLTQNITGGGSLAKIGTLDLTLSGANTYTGGTTITSGSVKVGSATALGANASAVTVASGAALDLNGITMTNTNALTLNGAGNGTGGLTNSSNNAATYAGAINLAGNSTIGSTGVGNTTTISGAITGAYNLTLNAANNQAIKFTTGGVNISGNVTNSGAGSGTVTLNGAIGTNVQNIIQSSSTSKLIFNAASTGFSGGIQILSGTVENDSQSTGNLGTGTITLGSNGADAVLLWGTNGGTLANAINVASGTGNRTIQINRLFKKICG